MKIVNKKRIPHQEMVNTWKYQTIGIPNFNLVTF